MDVKTTINQFIIDELEEGNVTRKKTRNTIANFTNWMKKNRISKPKN